MPLLTNLKAHWRMNEASGNRIDSHQGLTLVQNGSVTSATGKLGDAAVFSGSSANYLSIASTADLQIGTSQFTLLGWVYPATGGGSVQNLYVKWGAGGNEILVRLNATRNLVAFLNDGSNKSVTSTTALSVDTWSFIAVRYNGINLSVSVNGGAWDNVAHTTGSQSGTESVTIGERPGTTGPLLGRIDSLSFIKEALSDADVTFIYNSANGRDYPFPRKTAGAGDWNDTATWEGAIIPGDGDSAEIGHAVAVSAAQTIGASAKPVEAPAIDIKSGGSLVVETGIQLTVKGDIICPASNATKLDLEAGAIIEFDGAENYRILLPGQYPGTTPVLRARGASGNRAQIRTKSGATGRAYIVGDGTNYSGLVDLEFATLTRLGSASINAIESGLAGTSDTEYSLFRLIDCIIDTCGEVGWYTNIGSHARVTLQRTLWKSTVSTNSLGWKSFVNLAGLGVRLIDECDFDKHVELLAPQDLTITSNIFGQGYTTTVGESDGWALSDGNLVVLDATFDTLNPCGDISNEYWIHSDEAAVNPHFMQAGVYPAVGTQTVDGCIYEFAGTDGQGDCILLATPGSAATVEVKNCITLPNSGGDSSGTLISALGNANVTFSAENNTVFCGGQPGIAVGETYAGHTDMVSSIRGNIFWDRVTGRSFKVADSGTDDTVSDLISSANLGFNAGFRMQSGSNGKGYDKLEFSAGTPGVGDIVEIDPLFIDSARDLRKWDQSLSGPGTIANAISEIRKRNEDSGYNSSYSIPALLSYVRGGFAPTQASYANTDHNGDDMGAVAVQVLTSDTIPSGFSLMFIGGG